MEGVWVTRLEERSLLDGGASQIRTFVDKLLSVWLHWKKNSKHLLTMLMYFMFFGFLAIFTATCTIKRNIDYSYIYNLTGALNALIKTKHCS